MKLKDLKPNECIVINSRKEAKQLRKLLKKENVKSNVNSSGFCINEAANHKCICILSHSNKLWFSYGYGVYKTEYTVKDFLPKKSKFKKDVNQELARLDNLTNDLSIRLSAFELNSFGIDIEDLKAFYSKQDYKEFKKLQLSSESTTLKPSIKTLTPETLKAITEPVTSAKLEVGKWYKYKSILVYIKDLDGNKAVGCGLGNGLWEDFFSFIITLRCDYILATHEEVETALIEEAKRRGFKAELKIKRLFNEGVIFKCLGDFYYSNNDGAPGLFDKSGYAIMQNGKWASIVKEPKEEIDFSKPGQLVINESGYVWMTTGKHEEDSFTGIYIKDGVATPSFTLGCVSKGCTKESYTLYTETITLKND